MPAYTVKQAEAWLTRIDHAIRGLETERTLALKTLEEARLRESAEKPDPARRRKEPDNRAEIVFRYVYTNVAWRISEAGEEEVLSRAYLALPDAETDQPELKREGWQVRENMCIFAHVVEPPADDGDPSTHLRESAKSADKVSQ